MKSVLRLSVLIPFIFAMVGNLSAESREAQWDKVEAAQQKGLPKTAIEELKPIIAAAIADKAYPEAIKAIGEKIALEGKIEGNKPEERIVRLWDVKDGRQRATPTAAREQPPIVAFSPDSRRLATAPLSSFCRTASRASSFWSITSSMVRRNRSRIGNDWMCGSTAPASSLEMSRIAPNDLSSASIDRIML